MPSVLKPQAVPSSDVTLFGQRNVHHPEVSTICRAECSSRNVARAGSFELPIPFQSALYSASPVAVRTFFAAAASDTARGRDDASCSVCQVRHVAVVGVNTPVLTAVEGGGGEEPKTRQKRVGYVTFCAHVRAMQFPRAISWREGRFLLTPAAKS